MDDVIKTELIIKEEQDEEESCTNPDDILEDEPSKTVSVVWDKKNTTILLEEYEKELDNFLHPKTKKKILWRRIAKRMAEKGCVIDAPALDQKMRNMKCTYNKIRHGNKTNRSGRGRYWPYFEKMEQLFVSDETVDKSNAASTSFNITDSSARSSQHPRLCNSLNNHKRKLEVYRKRFLQLQEESIEEIKNIRQEIKESNRLNREISLLMQKFLERE